MKDYKLVTIESSGSAKVLQEKAQELTFPLSDEAAELANFLKKKILELGGVGLAAPQVGEPWQMMVVSISEQAADMRKNGQGPVEPTIYINPSYQASEGAELEADWEGCFSVETVTGKVPRFNQIDYKAYNEQGELLQGSAHGFTARVMQHEIDHLQGILIGDKLTQGTLHGHPKDMALLRCNEMNTAQKALMKTMILEAKERGDSQEHYQDLLAMLEESAQEND